MPRGRPKPSFFPTHHFSKTTYYITTAAAAAVAYDQVLTFSQEVDLVWKRGWSLMTLLYLIARYSGSLCIIGLAAWVICINWSYTVGVAMYLVVNWSSNIFILAMQAILVIRVYALCNKSKKILIFLVTCFCLQAIAVMVMAGLIFNLRVMKQYVVSVGASIGSVAQITTIDSSAFYPPPQDSTIIVVAFDAVVSLVALFAFVQHALETRNLDGKWSVNALVKLLVADQMLYFICYLAWLSISLATNYVESGVSEV
ncbi:hypothetical protein BV22DRAFT_796784 [Leucogyrophana mollusca]|uniref:Uncharacterized protein n=1 Tax=Leucogyrophana mollusca TaxID=85980 RepID=A0ACB8B416_9AGAM|nr:hypothetical protein BV22DRAFT_796784 [Leucogyrophana mollusca]